MRPLATWWIQLTEGVNYYRAVLPARYLPGKVMPLQSKRDIRIVGDDELAFPTQEGVAIAMFPGNAMRAGIFRLMRDQGTRVLVEVDDNYRCHPPHKELTGWLEDEVDHRRHSYRSHEVIVRHMDGVIVSTPALEREYRDLHDTIYVCPNQIDPSDWPLFPEHQPGGVLRVGWAASDSHGVDAALVEDALVWASRQDGVEVVIMGIQTWAPDCPHTYIPFLPMADYRQAAQNIDVMLCPLRPGRWADCKSDVKAMEAAMSGACAVVSKAEPYRPWFDGPAMVADRRRGFLGAVQYLVRHRDEAADMAAKARDYVLAERTIQRNVWRWREACADRVAVAA